MPESCARCGLRPAAEESPLCDVCVDDGPLTPDEAARWRTRRLEDGPASELVLGEEYDVRTSDGTVYKDAAFAGVEAGILLFDVFGGIARVGVADHEFAGIEP